jgi:UDP-glucose 4-epimerase
MRDYGYAKEPIYNKPHKGPARPGDIRRSCLDTRKAKNRFGWTPEYDLRAGLAKTLKWLLGMPAKGK